MTSRSATIRTIAFLCIATIARAQTPAAIAAFDAYTAQVEARLSEQHHSSAAFLATSPSHSTDPTLEQLTPSGGISLPGALLHHWRATAFVPGASAAQLEQLLKNISSYPQYFAPQVLRTKLLAGSGDHMQIVMRTSQRHIITVVMDSIYDVTFGQLDAQHGYSSSKSTAIAEIESAGTHSEHALSPADAHGFLWRQNTYWSYEERDGGLMMQIESLSLSRSIPTGLGWAVRPFVESVPRDSLDFTLRSVSKALCK